MEILQIIGGGLAGCEAAWQAAQRGVHVTLYEMRPEKSTGAHTSGNLAELVCSNSLGSQLIDRPSGLLKEELHQMGSLLLDCAKACSVPAGGALAVDRDAFSDQVTKRIEQHPLIKVIRQEITSIPEGLTIIASGPLTSKPLEITLQKLTGKKYLSFYDAIAPIITQESINMEIAFQGSRFQRGLIEGGDYINCPFTKDQYQLFVQALKTAERGVLREFEDDIHQGVRAGSSKFFESCLPVEILAERGLNTLAFGPMRPIGLHNPHTGNRPYAVIQLRQDNLAKTLYNIVGFQTNLTFIEQRCVFRMIPGLENAEFVRFGQMHRNTFIASPILLNPTLELRSQKNLFFAGQITGVEGYMGNIATGLLAGINGALSAEGQELLILPKTTMSGALCHYISNTEIDHFQPMKANFGLLPSLEHPEKGRRERALQFSQRALHDLSCIWNLLSRKDYS